MGPSVYLREFVSVSSSHVGQFGGGQHLSGGVSLGAVPVAPHLEGSISHCEGEVCLPVSRVSLLRGLGCERAGGLSCGETWVGISHGGALRERDRAQGWSLSLHEMTLFFPSAWGWLEGETPAAAPSPERYEQAQSICSTAHASALSRQSQPWAGVRGVSPHLQQQVSLSWRLCRDTSSPETGAQKQSVARAPAAPSTQLGSD